MFKVQYEMFQNILWKTSNATFNDITKQAFLYFHPLIYFLIIWINLPKKYASDTPPPLQTQLTIGTPPPLPPGKKNIWTLVWNS